jgi:hypothetical protein
MGTADDGPQVSSPEWALAVAHVFERHISSSPFADWIALIEHEHRAGDPSPTNLANSAALVDLPIPCAYDDEAGLATFLPPTALNNLTGVTPLSLKDWSFGQRHLLNHFLQSVSRALVVVDDEDNPFLRLIVPMVLENAMVRHGLLALSACHLSRVYPVFEKDLLIHRSLALQKLRTDLVNHESQLYCLVTTLLLCLAEVCYTFRDSKILPLTNSLKICEGRSRMWLLHLHGAKALLANIDAAALTEAPYRAMVDLYNYLCCVTSATAHDGPLPLFEEQFMPEDSHFHPLFGVATNLYKTISLISRLTQIMRNLPASTPEIEKQAQEIELSLQSWTPAENGAGNRRMSEARAAAFATQWALMLQLKQVMKNLKNDDPQITMAANNILSALSLIRPGSEIETRILFPLFMAGVGSVTKPNRLTVEYRLKIMESMIGFGNISVAHKLLDELWRRSNDGDTVDWEDLKEAQYSGLVLL